MTQRMNTLHNFIAISFFMVITIFLIPGCSSEPKAASFPESADANQEISLLTEELEIAGQDEVDIMAPRSFEKAQKYLSQARVSREKNKDNQEILNSVAMSKSYLNLAQEQVGRVKPSVSGILKTREEAISSRASTLLPKKFEQVEKDLTDVTAELERKRSAVTGEKFTELQKKYLDLQAESMKISRLDSVQSAIETAKKNGARKYAPRTLASAESQYNAAANIIETDRHNAVGIQKSSQMARAEATKLLNVTAIARENKISEDVAIELNARRIANARMNEEVSQTEALLKEEKEAADKIRLENANLEKKNEFNETFTWAQEQFNPNEAEVYRQGDQLLIRLKSMNFQSGQKELSTSAYPILSKVKDVIAKMGAEKVKVEGHTDSTGNRNINKNLSKARAESVAGFLADEKLIGRNQFEVEGLGFEKPVSTNKTSEGRAQNRRVDIILTPRPVADDGSSVE